MTNIVTIKKDNVGLLKEAYKLLVIAPYYIKGKNKEEIDYINKVAELIDKIYDEIYIR